MMKMLRPLVILLLMLLVVPAADARRRRTGPAKLRREAAEATTAATLPQIYDTIVPAAGLISCAGYDKPNSATRETFFITNADTLDLECVNLTLEYFDMKGRQLHSATHSVSVELPAGQTRSVSVPSWDRNNAFHYFRSAAPKRRRSTPYSVKARVNYLLRLRAE